jgi:hypothetical protein
MRQSQLCAYAAAYKGAPYSSIIVVSLDHASELFIRASEALMSFLQLVKLSHCPVGLTFPNSSALTQRTKWQRFSSPVGRHSACAGSQCWQTTRRQPAWWPAARAQPRSNEARCRPVES